MGDGSIGARRVLTPAGWTGPAVVEIDGDRIAAVHPTAEDQPDLTIVPGFVDLQVNGIEGDDVATAEGEAWGRLDAALLAQGVTTWCPTLVTAPMDSYGPALARVAAADARPGAGPRPEMAGVHLEGPFLGGAPGAHRRDLLRPVDLDWIRALPPGVRIMTIAPELDHAREAIVALADQGVVASLGHSTATYGQAVAAAEAGARLVTHLHNGMSPFHHRSPGLAGAALVVPALVPSIIADNVHVHPAVVRAAFATRRDTGIILVTDAVAWRDRPGVSVGDGAPRLADGTLAGTVLTMDGAVRHVTATGVDLAQAVAAASTTPAQRLGLYDRGLVAPGLRADLVALTAELAVAQVWVGGDPCHR